MPPIRTKGSFYTLETSLKKGEDCRVVLPLALRALGKCAVFVKEAVYTNQVSKYGMRWAGVGDLSRIRKIVFQGRHDVLNNMRASKSGVVDFAIASGASFSEVERMTIEVFTEESREMKRAVAASTLCKLYTYTKLFTLLAI